MIHLSPLEEYLYENDYHYHLQGLIYSLMREAEQTEVHDRTGYKYFCFSNLFPYHETLKKGSEVDLLVSTPDKELADGLCRALDARIRGPGRSSSIIKIGKTELEIKSFDGPFRIAKLKEGEPVKLRSATPIIIRIPKWRYEEYGIKSERPFEYWRDSIALEAFVKQLRDSMEKKIAQFGTPEMKLGYTDRLSEPNRIVALPEVISYRFLKMVSKPITVKGEKQQTVGSLWEFEFLPQNQEESRNLEFALDCGFGERNSLGFGFMNPV